MFIMMIHFCGWLLLKVVQEKKHKKPQTNPTQRTSNSFKYQRKQVRIMGLLFILTLNKHQYSGWNCLLCHPSKNSQTGGLTTLPSVSSSAFVRLINVVHGEAERLIIAHKMVVVLWDGKQLWVHQKSKVVGVEGGEHLTDGWDPDLALVEHALLFSQEDAVGDGSVGVSVWVVIKANDIAFGDNVEEDRGDEGEEADAATECRLQGDALDS